MKKLLVVILVFIVGGCATTGSIQRTLEERKSALKYVYDSEKIVEKAGGTLKIGSFVVDDVLPPDLSIERKSSSVLPLIFVNTWKQELQATLGYTQIENDYKKFMRESFIEEVKRSCRYADTEDRGDITLDVTIKKIEISAPIVQRGNFLFLVFVFAAGSRTQAGPVDVAVQADVVLKKSGNDILKKEVIGKHKTGLLVDKNVVKDYTVSMIEGLSLAIKDLNEKIVTRINQI